MIIPGLDNNGQGRLQNLLLGRSRFEAFSFEASGRKLHVWVFDDEAQALLKADGYAAPAEPQPEPAPEAEAPEAPPQPPVRVVPVRTGARAAGTPVHRPEEIR